MRWKEKKKEMIKVDDNDYPLCWMDCDFCKGFAESSLSSGSNYTMKEMQEFHDNHHRVELIRIGEE